MFTYFVSYSFDGGNGRCFLEREHPIETREDVENIEKSIAKDTHKNKVLILNWIHLSKRMESV